jgi:hypothetical protein
VRALSLRLSMYVRVEWKGSVSGVACGNAEELAAKAPTEIEESDAISSAVESRFMSKVPLFKCDEKFSSTESAIRS